MNSKKEYICIAGIFIFIALTSFKISNDYSVSGLKQPFSLSYSDGILYVVNKNGYISMLDKYGHILELEFLDIKGLSDLIAYQDKLVVSRSRDLLFYKKPSKLVKVVDFHDTIKKLANQSGNILVLLNNGDCFLVNHNTKFLFNIPDASSIALSNKYIFAVAGNFIKVYDKHNHLITSKTYSFPIDSISYNDGYLALTSASYNRVFLLNENLEEVESFKFDKPSFVYYSKQKLFVCSSKLGRIYIKNN
jgi:hypothetical protein